MEKISELGNNLQESIKINVEKNNGIKERFSYEKLMKSLIMVETPFFESDKIIATVVSQLYDGIKTKEIKKIVHPGPFSLSQTVLSTLFKKVRLSALPLSPPSSAPPPPRIGAADPCHAAKGSRSEEHTS